MSQPISSCIQMKAVVDEETHKELFEVHKKNHINGGHYTTFGCSHTPPCNEKYGITPEILEKYNERMKKEWDVFMKEHDKEKCYACGNEGRRGYMGEEGEPGLKN